MPPRHSNLHILLGIPRKKSPQLSWRAPPHNHFSLSRLSRQRTTAPTAQNSRAPRRNTITIIDHEAWQGKNQRANHICGWQIKNREWPLCDSESSIFFFGGGGGAGQKLAPWPAAWESTNKIRIIILRAPGRCCAGGAVGSGACETSASLWTDGSRKRMHSPWPGAPPPTRVLVLPRSNLLSIAHCAIAAEACKAFYSHLHAHQPCSANRPAQKHNSLHIIYFCPHQPLKHCWGSSPVFRSLLLCFRSTSVTLSSLTRAILSMRL